MIKRSIPRTKELKESEVLELTCLSLGKKGDGIFKTETGLIIIAKKTRPKQKYELKIIKVSEKVAFAEVIQKVKNE